MVAKAVQTVSLFISFFLHTEVKFPSNIVVNTEYYFYSAKLRTESKYFVSSRMNRQDPDYDSCEEFICPLSPGLEYPSDNRVFVVYQWKLRELLTSCAKCRFKINQKQIREGKNNCSQKRVVFCT